MVDYKDGVPLAPTYGFDPVACPPELEEKIEAAAENALKMANADWGPVFVYGTMLSPEVWAALIDRIPDMRPGILKGYQRKAVGCTGLAAIIKAPEGEFGMTIGQVVFGLLPMERRLLDQAIEDMFILGEVDVRFLDAEEDEFITCSCYMFKEEFADAIGDDDWNFEKYQDETLSEFRELCRDLRAQYIAERLSDEDLKELAMARRRKEAAEETPRSELTE
eukprot:TRINITY_DN11555_c0_g1_i2.p1 TRINITY_DN11555_c0_g1~~TRINITY_DN11555_c0_g1_i2.p1  ORF type:complete len:221 (-),score=59.37 TRINITY_DN11555_c0_g1_i2:50-712(-)